MIELNNLKEEAIRVLRGNRIGDYTVPCRSLYPFQWNWDTGFNAIGLSHFDIRLVYEEYRALFSGQWKNGMLPHIIFHSDEQEGYFPNASYWKSGDLSYSSEKVQTSGITQPPVHGFILEHILKQHPDEVIMQNLIEELYPDLLRLHGNLYSDRDPYGEGLVYIYHPWESGRDNSPVWDEILSRMKVDKSEIPRYQRVDNLKADPSHRPTDEDYMKYVYLMETGRKNGYAGSGITDNSPFLVQDTLFNAMLISSERSLISLGKILGKNVREIEERLAQSIRNYNDKLWNDKLKTYVSFDLKSGKQLEYREIGGITALFANIADEQRAELVKTSINRLVDNRQYYLYPSFDPESPLFDPRRYWKGPIWPQMNWLIIQGLKKYNYLREADLVKNHFLSLVRKNGFYEYFDPRITLADEIDTGYGGKDFSWTSAVVLDLIS